MIYSTPEYETMGIECVKLLLKSLNTKNTDLLWDPSKNEYSGGSNVKLEGQRKQIVRLAFSG